jgi:hypothetical protein
LLRSWRVETARNSRLVILSRSAGLLRACTGISDLLGSFKLPSVVCGRLTSHINNT